MVKHVVGGRNKQVLPQWKCHWCNIQFDNMGSVILFECGLRCANIICSLYIIFDYIPSLYSNVAKIFGHLVMSYTSNLSHFIGRRSTCYTFLLNSGSDWFYWTKTSPISRIFELVHCWGNKASPMTILKINIKILKICWALLEENLTNNLTVRSL